MRRAYEIGTRGLSLTLALCLSARCSAPGTVGPPAVGTIDTCVFPAHFIDQMDHEIEFKSFEALPAQIQTRLRQYLSHRLGTEFSQRLRFREASFMDPAQVPEVVQAEQQLGGVYVAYVILFDIPLSDGSTYCAGLHMTGDGVIVMGIGLPSIAESPTKAHILTMSAAEVVALQHGISDPDHGLFTHLQYSPDRDALVWAISEVSPGMGGRPSVTTCNIDAHTGQFLGWTSGEIFF